MAILSGNALQSAALSQTKSPITKADLESVPAPVRRYLMKSGVVGRVPISCVFLRQRGRFRMVEGGAWAHLRAQQHYTVNPPSFEWHATISPSPLIYLKVTDAFTNGHGWLVAKLFGLFRLAAVRGPETDHGELLRFLSEILWFPTAWLADYISWRALDDRSAEVTISFAGVSASATLFFNDENDVDRFEAMRHRITGRSLTLDRWALAAEVPQIVNGLRIPTKGQATWKLPTGADFTYFDAEVTSVEYDTT